MNIFCEALLLIVLLISICILPIIQGNLHVGWIENTFSAGIYCSGLLEGLVPCHLIAHWVLYAYESENIPLHHTVSPRIAWIQTVRFHYSAINFLVPKGSIL